MSIFEGTVTYKVLKPITWEDKTIDEVVLDFSKANGDMLNKVEIAVTNSKNSMAILPAYSNEYCVRLAGMLSGIRYEALRKLHMSDFKNLWLIVAAIFNDQDPQEVYDHMLGKFADNVEYEEVDEADFTIPATLPEPK